MNCPGSVAAEAEMPPEVRRETGAAAEGTAAHELAEWCLRNFSSPAFYPKTHINGFEITDEMRDGVGLYVQTVREVFGVAHRSLEIESRVSLEDLNPPVEMYGTADAVIYDAESKRLTVIDLKYGAGHYVSAENNPQLLYYALGAVLKYTAKGYTILGVEVIIVQPRRHEGDPVRRMRATARELDAFSKTLIEAAWATQQKDAVRHAGSWCRYCRARPLCPAALDQAQEVTRMSFDVLVPSPPAPTQLTEEQLQRVLLLAPQVEEWITSVRAHAAERARRGDLPGWKLVAKRPTRKWKDAEQAEKVLGGLLFERSIRSVAAVEKVVGKKQMSQYEALITKQSSGAVLVQDSDRRPAITGEVQFDVLTEVIE
jgi:hypothetical protein